MYGHARVPHPQQPPPKGSCSARTMPRTMLACHATNGPRPASAGAYAENLPVICICGGPNTNDFCSNHIIHHTLGEANVWPHAPTLRHTASQVAHMLGVECVGGPGHSWLHHPPCPERTCIAECAAVHAVRVDCCPQRACPNCWPTFDLGHLPAVGVCCPLLLLLAAQRCKERSLVGAPFASLKDHLLSAGRPLLPPCAGKPFDFLQELNCFKEVTCQQVGPVAQPCWTQLPRRLQRGHGRAARRSAAQRSVGHWKGKAGHEAQA